jgi:diguanylate cyclase (GGDEF)-like protein
MGKLLVVDDRAVNRQFLTTLLGYGGHELLEAADGAEALAKAQAELPDVIIADILMPTMDGYEFVRQLRSDPTIAQTPVIFYTAAYHEHEAAALAKACCVHYLIKKPSDPAVILQTVEAALRRTPPPVLPPPGEEFDQEHLRLLTNKLTAKVEELEAANLRLAALFEFGQQLASEDDAVHLLAHCALTAREVIGARYAAVGVLDEAKASLEHFFTSGADTQADAQVGLPALDRGVLAPLLNNSRTLRVRDIGAEPLAAGLPPPYLPTRPLLGAQISSPGGTCGLVYLIEKLGAEEFSAEDERLLATLAAQVGVAYESARRHEQNEQRVMDLARHVAERKRAEERLRKLNTELEQRVQQRTAALDAANRALQSLAIVDDLTGLHNRRGFLTLAAHQLKLAQRACGRLLLVFCDLDGLKGINDRFGHSEGDRALRAVAEIFKKTFRDSDIIGRLGGDEYAVLAIDAADRAAEICTARLRENLRSYNAQQHSGYPLSLSVGLVHFDAQNTSSVEELLAAADQRMYQQKRGNQTASSNSHEVSGKDERPKGKE